MTYTSVKGKQANEARVRGEGYERLRQHNICTVSSENMVYGPYCDICGVDVGRVAVTLDPAPLHLRSITICRDCAKRVGELVGLQPLEHHPLLLYRNEGRW